MSRHKERLSFLLQAVLRNSGRSHAFEHFLIMLAAAISNRFSKDSAAAGDRESRYLEVVNKYKREDVHRFVEAATELIMALEDCIGQKCLRVNSPVLSEIGFEAQFPIKGTKPRFGDILGEVFHEMHLNERHGGQIFTPNFAADIMANVTLTDEFIDAEIKRSGFIVIQEDCCGSGVITLNALNRLLERGINPQRQSLVIASDIDERCVLMTFIQLSFYGIPAVVTQKDSTSGVELSPPWYTPMFTHDEWLARCKDYVPPKAATAEKPAPEIEQLTLF